MSKRIISLILIITMCFTFVPMNVFAADDNPSSWAAEQVNRAITEMLVPQSLQSNYTQAATRAEFCALAVALYENVKGTITGRTTFSDTNDINVEKAASIGVVSGVGDNKFDPGAKMTREQAAVMLSRLADAVGKPFEVQASTFADNTRVSSWALTGVGQVQAAGIMGGVGGNTFAPHDPYTREQSIITILRTYDAVKGAGIIDPTKQTVTSTEPWTGTWKSNKWLEFGIMNLTQTGNVVTGTYDEREDGNVIKISGIVTGNVLEGIKKPNEDTQYRFVLLDGGGQFQIEYWVGSMGWRNYTTANRIVLETTPVGNHTKTLVGDWEATWRGSRGSEDEIFSDTSNITEDYTKPYGQGFHFYDNGTFKYVHAVAIQSGVNDNITQNGVTIWRGNYRAENGILYLTNVTVNYTPRANDPSGIKAYKNRSASDMKLKYAFGDDKDAYVRINVTENEDFGSATKFYDMKYKTPAENN